MKWFNVAKGFGFIARRFQTFPPLDDIDDDGLPFAQSGEAGSFKGGYVDEYVLPAAIPRVRLI